MSKGRKYNTRAHDRECHYVCLGLDSATSTTSEMSKCFPELSTRRTRGWSIHPLALDPLVDGITLLHVCNYTCIGLGGSHGLGKDVSPQIRELGHLFEMGCCHRKVSFLSELDVHCGWNPRHAWEICYRAKPRMSATDVLLLKHQTDLNLLFLQMYNFLLGYKDKLDSKPHSTFPELFH